MSGVIFMSNKWLCKIVYYIFINVSSKCSCVIICNNSLISATIIPSSFRRRELWVITNIKKKNTICVVQDGCYWNLNTFSYMMITCLFIYTTAISTALVSTSISGDWIIISQCYRQVWTVICIWISVAFLLAQTDPAPLSLIKTFHSQNKVVLVLHAPI